MSENENANQPYPNPYYYPQALQAFYPAYDPRQVPQNQPQNQPPNQQTPPPANGNGMLPMEQSYIENILRLNEGKRATVYMTFENNDQWNAKVFRGIIEAAGRDHIILSDPQTEKRYLLLMIYLDYITFEGEINYSYPYGSNQMSAYPPR
ncbi:spore coat protein GerQ [Virgibacillus doumboii]|uniref:spore coat protein GerQ n=1 Tax=Virgibacillus doumboii TaxID=2697503 RepID=UPI0013DF9666|nr:spore coat protein GerQ [Virgibacillus doumboii]